MWFKRVVRDYFFFNKRERSGLFILCSIIFILLLIKIFSEEIFTKNEKQDFSLFIQQLQSNQSLTEEDEFSVGSDEVKVNEEKKIKNFNSKKGELFAFNPNKLPESEWIRLGFSPKQAKSIKKFEASGGYFSQKSDLKKLYCVSEEMYKRLEPFIVLPELAKQTAVKNESKINKGPQIVDINFADTTELIKLPFIGPSIAKRIIKYRERLGGFYEVDQLLEVYGMDSIRFQQIKERLRADSRQINPININSVSIDDLKKHPYLKYAVAKSIVMIRDRHGKYKNKEEIRKSDLINEELYLKIAPYLSTE